MIINLVQELIFKKFKDTFFIKKKSAFFTNSLAHEMCISCIVKIVYIKTIDNPLILLFYNYEVLYQCCEEQLCILL